MKKKMIGLLAAMMPAMMSCTSEPDVTATLTPEPQEEKVITFTFGSRAATRSDIETLNLTDLWLFDYADGELRQTVHETDDIGSIDTSLTYGQHTLYFVASKGTEPTVDEDGQTITWVRPSDTFWATATITVAPASNVSETVELHRVATRLKVAVNDEVPTEASKLIITPAQWYYGIDYTTGDGVAPSTDHPREINIPSSYIGTTGQLAAMIFGFVPQTDWHTGATITMCGSGSSTLGSVTIDDIPFKRNITTSYSGSLTVTGRTFTLTADDAWGDEETHTW